jgi:phage tail-like protein
VAGATGVRFDPHLQCNFLVEIEGLLVGGFSNVSGLEYEVEYEEFREGGVNGYTHKLPSGIKYPQNLVLERGLTDLDFLSSWSLSLLELPLLTADYQEKLAQGDVRRRDGSIYLLDNRRLPVMWWNFKGAYPVRWSGPRLQADTSTVAVETVELVHQGIVKPRASRALAAARLAASL